MSVRSDIMQNKRGWRRLSYTRRCGWVDWGHAQPGAASILKRQVAAEQADWVFLRDISITLAGQPAYVLNFGEEMGKFGLVVSNVAHFVVRKELTPAERWGVALAIFEEASVSFETMQASPPFSWTSDSGFSGEDLVSDLIGFYGVYRRLSDAQMRVIAGEVSIKESLRIWDEQLPNGIGGLKNHRFAPVLFPTTEGVDGPGATTWPQQFTGITPLSPGRHWVAVRGRFIDGRLINAGIPLETSSNGDVTPARPAKR